MQRAISVALFPFAVLRLRIIRNRGRARLFGRRYRYTVLENRGRRVWEVTPIERKGLVVSLVAEEEIRHSVGRSARGILIKNNQYCNINKCPSRLYQLPVVVATSPHFPRFPLKNQYARPAQHATSWNYRRHF